MLVKTAYNQPATYWPQPTEDGWGSKTFVAGTLFNVRWENVQEIFINSEGNEQLSNAMVFVPQEVEVGGYIVLGDHTAVSDPTTLEDSYYISRVDNTPDLRGLQKEIIAYL